MMENLEPQAGGCPHPTRPHHPCPDASPQPCPFSAPGGGSRTAAPRQHGACPRQLPLLLLQAVFE